MVEQNDIWLAQVLLEERPGYQTLVENLIHIRGTTVTVMGRSDSQRMS